MNGKKVAFNTFAGRATFLSPMVHRQSDIFVVVLAQCKVFSNWLFIDLFNVNVQQCHEDNQLWCRIV